MMKGMPQKAPSGALCSSQVAFVVVDKVGEVADVAGHGVVAAEGWDADVADVEAEGPPAFALRDTESLVVVTIRCLFFDLVAKLALG